MNGRPSPVDAQYLRIAKRIQQLAQQGNGNGLITLHILVDRDSNVRHVAVRRQPLEPKTGDLDWLLDLIAE